MADLCKSQMTGCWYLVTKWSRPGVAKVKHDVTDAVNAMLEEQAKLWQKQVDGANAETERLGRLLVLSHDAQENAISGERCLCSDCCTFAGRDAGAVTP